MIETTENQRLKILRLKLNFQQGDFATEIGLKQGSYSDVERGRAGISYDVLSRLYKQFKVNPIWIMTGEGEMFVNDFLQSINGSEVNEPKPEYHPVMVTVDSVGQENIVLVEAKAAAGYVQHLFEPHYFKSLPTLYLPGKEFRNATHRAFQITGDSMQNTLSHGDIVIARFIENFDIKEGYVHVVITKETLYIKRILNRIDQRGKLVLLSDNKYYTPVEIDAQEVTELWYVSRYISSNLSNKGAEIYNMILDVNDRLHQLETRVDAIKPSLNLE